MTGEPKGGLVIRLACTAVVAVLATVAIYILPLPFQGTLLLACGIVCGRLSAKFV
jgi:hypothetical protein